MQENRATIARVEAAQSLTRVGGRQLAYRARSSTLALVFIMALSPIWLLWSLAAALMLIGSMLSHLLRGQGIDEVFFPMTCFYLFLTTVGAFAVCVCRDIKLTFNGDEISFPSRFLFELRGRLTRKWSELVCVDFRDRSGAHSHPQNMTMHFSSGGSVPLAIAGMRREDLNELIQAIQLFAPQTQFLPQLSALKLDLVSGFDAGLSGLLQPTFTQLWEDELASRFGSTIFVPLEAGAELQEGSLEVVGQLCFGGLSAVYLAERGGETVILKEAVLPLGCDAELKEKALAMFGREASILASLKHQRIAAVRDYFVENGRHYILLDHIEGIDLRRFVREQGAQSPGVVLRWLAEMTDILIYLHDHEPPVVHRDVTPDNIVLARDGHLSLIDFGAANNLVGTATGTLVGKQSYISPEQFRGKASPQSDLYSLGATVYFALTGLDPEPLTRLTLRLEEDSRDGRSQGGQIGTGLANIVKDLTEQDLAQRTKSSLDLKLQVDTLKQSMSQ